LPEVASERDPEQWCLAHGLGLPIWLRDLAVRRHTFSHFHLDIMPREFMFERSVLRVLEADTQVWYNVFQPDSRGLAAPVSRLLQELVESPFDKAIWKSP
jgi:A/G-specific adenine glycosylase